MIIAVLHTLDRQGEYVARTDFLWKAKLKVEQEEVETMRGINKVFQVKLRGFFQKLALKQNFIFLADSLGKHFASSRGHTFSASRTFNGIIS